jgi:SLT domain-containing protein
MPNDPGQVYTLAHRLLNACLASGHDDIAQQIDDALHAGSSALETLGGIRNALLQHDEVLREFAEPSEIDAAIAYIDTTFGRRET